MSASVSQSAYTTQWGPNPVGDINAGFLLNSAYLVFFMHCGFAMLSIGCVRAKFAKHIAILILVDACASALGWYLFGFAFAFGDPAATPNGIPTQDANAFVGYKNFAMHDMDPSVYYFWVFEWTFAATACTIVSGAIAERARLEAYIMYSFFMSSWVYPVIIHSVWSQAGWASMFRSSPYLGKFMIGYTGAIDFAGSGAVHMVGGYAAIAGCWILGPRIGRYNADGTANEMPGHNASLFVLGVMILWFGWYGFNPGSQLVIISNISNASYAVSNAAVTTSLAPAAGGMSALLVNAIIHKVAGDRTMYDVMVMGNGALAGLVAITAGCSTVYPWAAIIIGAVAGAIYCGASRVSIMLRLDDPLDAIAVHAWNGTWGVWAVGLFAGSNLIQDSYGTLPSFTNTTEVRPYGCFMGGGGHLLAAQLIYSVWLACWVLGMMIPFWLILKVCGMFRVPAAVEEAGLDHSYHGGSAYPGGPEEMTDKSLRPGNGAGGGYNGGSNSEIAELRAEIAAIKKSHTAAV